MTESATSDRALQDFATAVGSDAWIAVAGARTRWSLGGELTEGTRVIVAPKGIREHVPDEMTVRVGAGTTVADLHAALADKGQRTALPERGGTVGGAVVVGENDFRMLGRGPLRNAVLQVRYVSAEGRLVSGGGPTVKNVSGFDLPRLITGSLGTLGLLGEVILRTNPIPATSLWLVSEDADPFVAIETLLAPSSVLWDGTKTWIELEGHAADVRSERRALGGAGTFTETAGPPTLPPHRWSCSPETLREPDSAWGEFVAAIGVGLVYASRPRPTREIDPAAAAIHRRLKQQFDPTGRLNPGREPARR